jgi:hypothetical protein
MIGPISTGNAARSSLPVIEQDVTGGRKQQPACGFFVGQGFDKPHRHA